MVHESGRPSEIARTRETLDRPYDDLERGRVKLIGGGEVRARLRARSGRVTGYGFHPEASPAPRVSHALPWRGLFFDVRRHRRGVSAHSAARIVVSAGGDLADRARSRENFSSANRE